MANAIAVKRIGRPRNYDPGIGEQLLRQFADGVPLCEACKAVGMPLRRTVQQWVATVPTFGAAYALARLAYADALVEQIPLIADDPALAISNEAVQHARLRIDARKWVASKLRPEKYGERLDVQADMTLNISVQRFTDAKVIEGK